MRAAERQSGRRRVRRPTARGAASSAPHAGASTETARGSSPRAIGRICPEPDGANDCVMMTFSPVCAAKQTTPRRAGNEHRGIHAVIRGTSLEASAQPCRVQRMSAQSAAVITRALSVSQASRRSFIAAANTVGTSLVARSTTTTTTKRYFLNRCRRAPDDKVGC